MMSDYAFGQADLPTYRAVRRHVECAAGHAGGDHRPLAAAAVRARRRSRMPDREIVATCRPMSACFAHGRQYFRNAARSEMSVKPLLLYYGALSCSRGVILANNAEKKEESLKPRHGLETVDRQTRLNPRFPLRCRCPSASGVDAWTMAIRPGEDDAASQHPSWRALSGSRPRSSSRNNDSRPATARRWWHGPRCRAQAPALPPAGRTSRWRSSARR